VLLLLLLLLLPLLKGGMRLFCVTRNLGTSIILVCRSACVDGRGSFRAKGAVACRSVLAQPFCCCWSNSHSGANWCWLHKWGGTCALSVETLVSVSGSGTAACGGCMKPSSFGYLTCLSVASPLLICFSLSGSLPICLSCSFSSPAPSCYVVGVLWCGGDCERHQIRREIFASCANTRRLCSASRKIRSRVSDSGFFACAACPPLRIKSSNKRDLDPDRFCSVLLYRKRWMVPRSFECEVHSRLSLNVRT